MHLLFTFVVKKRNFAYNYDAIDTLVLMKSDIIFYNVPDRFSTLLETK